MEHEDLAEEREHSLPSDIAILFEDAAVVIDGDLLSLSAFVVQFENIVLFDGGFGDKVAEVVAHLKRRRDAKSSGSDAEVLADESALRDPSPGSFRGEVQTRISCEFGGESLEVFELSVRGVPEVAESDVGFDSLFLTEFELLFEPLFAVFSPVDFGEGIGELTSADLGHGDASGKDGVGEAGALSDQEPVWSEVIVR